ncbi:hypothetical protein S40293_08394 [Stachybotrys chartarum IBT 40293]|nr:hypothetical protein S40293_08394 [Stachybotrys chartarum IBT 40293]
MSRRLVSFLFNLTLAAAQLSSSSLEAHVDTLTLSHSFNPIKEAYWTGYPHHRRTPFAVSPNGQTAFLAYLDESETDVHVQAVDPTSFAAVGDAVTIVGGKEAGGLVAHDDGFALLTNEISAGAGDIPVPVLYRYTDGQQTFKTLLGGPGIDPDSSLASPDINGDLVYSEASGYYAAYIVVTATEGWASGHFGDAIRYVSSSGELEMIDGASSSWGCSHNTGIAFEAADEPPFASICAEDQGAIWYNSMTRGMSNNGVKISNEKVINGGSNEPMGGTSGSYSSLARFIGEDSYIFAWVSRGAVNLGPNDWMGDGYTKAENRTNNRNVAIALFSDKATIVGEQATSEVGAASGDDQVNWLTQGSNDRSNAHVATFDASRALVAWEEISNPSCPFEAMGCAGTFAGTMYQMVGSDGLTLGEPINSMDTYVSGDMVTVADGRICWPYVAMDWKLDGPTRGTAVTKMSFACINADGSAAPAPSAPAVSSTPAAEEPVATEALASTEAPVASEETPATALPNQPSASAAAEDPRPTSVQSSSVSDAETLSQLPPTSVTASEPTPTSIVDAVSSAAPVETSIAPGQPSSSAAALVSTRTRRPRPTGRPGRRPRPSRTSSDCPPATLVTEWQTVYVTASAAY